MCVKKIFHNKLSYIYTDTSFINSMVLNIINFLEEKNVANCNVSLLVLSIFKKIMKIKIIFMLMMGMARLK